MTAETVHLDGHIIDNQTLSRVLDLILLHGGSYEITQFRIGTRREEPSHAEIVVQAPGTGELHHILQEIGHAAPGRAHRRGAGPAAARWRAPQDRRALQRHSRVHLPRGTPLP